MSDTNKDTNDKGDGKEGSEHLNLKVQGQDGSLVHFKIKRSTQLKKLMNTYCERQGYRANFVRFMFDGNPIKENDTPNQLEMDDGDTIEVYLQQTGGCSVRR